MNNLPLTIHLFILRLALFYVFTLSNCLEDSFKFVLVIHPRDNLERAFNGGLVIRQVVRCFMINARFYLSSIRGLLTAIEV